MDRFTNPAGFTWVKIDSYSRTMLPGRTDSICMMLTITDTDGVTYTKQCGSEGHTEYQDMRKGRSSTTTYVVAWHLYDGACGMSRA